MKTFRRTVCAWALTAMFVLAAALGGASPVTAAPLEVTIRGAGQSNVKVVLATPLGSSSGSAEMEQAISHNLRILPFIDLLDSRSIPGGAGVTEATAQGIEFQRFLMAGANLLITTHWTQAGQVELRAFEVAEGRFMFGNRYDVTAGREGVRDVADKFCDDFLEVVIGRGSFFSSTMAFTKSGGRYQQDVWAVKPNGRDLRRLTNLRGEALSPTWSPDGRYVLFTHIDPHSHALGIYDGASHSARRIRFPGNTVIGPSFMPNNTVAVGLTDGRNPSIFLLDHSFQKQRRLEGSSAIDVSPSVDASGALMAFTSSRLGNPQIFLKNLRSGATRRVSMSGSYNTDPSISPDGTLVAFARQMGGGHRIFVHDLTTGQERQITFGPGSDEEPAFAPDGYFVAFMSTRSGQRQIYFTTRYGGTPTLLPTGQGDAAFPAWGVTYRGARTR